MKTAIFVALLLLPILTSLLGLGWPYAVAAVLLLLLANWLLTLGSLLKPRASETLVLDSIAASHYVEKVRWCLDRLGTPYEERPAGGTLGVFFLGRTVPRLRFQTGMVESSIGNSPEILRYLWGRFGVLSDQQGEFLRPSRVRLELEQSIDLTGRHLQVWVYSHLLDHRHPMLQAWGLHHPQVPWWQRGLLWLLYPLLRVLMKRAFQLNPDHLQRARQRIDQALAAAEEQLADGRKSLLGEAEPNYTDFSFAAIHGLWLQPQGFGGAVHQPVRVAAEHLPVAMVQDITGWKQRFPLCVRHIETLYRHFRRPLGDNS